MPEYEKNKIRVLIVDDSPLMREMLTSILAADAALEVVATANDGLDAVARTKRLRPDVITMDLNMPVMSGQEAIQKIMEELPTPILVVSSLKVEVGIKALTLGAMDLVSTNQEADLFASELIEKVKIAAHVKALKRIRRRSLRQVAAKCPPGVQIIGVGASTGGPQALECFLSKLPPAFPAGILVVQHISTGFIQGLAEYLQECCSLEVRLARAGETLKAGTVLFAPDNSHLEISPQQVISLVNGSAGSDLHIPSIDRTMTSIASAFGSKAIGVIMTGMAKDGVEGMGAIKRAGGMTFAQDEKTSAIFGMNKLAIDAGYVDMVVPIERLADEIVDFTCRHCACR